MLRFLLHATILCFGAVAFAAPDPATYRNLVETQDQYWAFRPLGNPQVPVAKDDSWSRNAVDRFVFRRLTSENIPPAPEADRRTLVRRLYFDLAGMPPTPEQVDAFLSDSSAGAYDRLVSSLLQSPRFGEHWGRHWLDVVRYADSGGFNADEYRPNAWKYRDWVIKAFNDDMPYDNFVRQQLAGDEIAPEDPAARIATGFLRLWPYESNQRNVRKQWGEILDNLTDITGDVFLGVSVGCAKCHDHKFDPIAQADYYKLRAFYSSIYPDDRLKAVTPAEVASHRERERAWLEKTAPIREAMEQIRQPIMKRLENDAVNVFSPEYQAIYAKPADERSAEERQVRLFMQLQVEMGQKALMKKMKKEEKARWDLLKEQLRHYRDSKPAELPEAMAVRTVAGTAPPTTIPDSPQTGEILPGYLRVVRSGGAEVSAERRRTVLANWLTDPENPLATRVMANRIWHYLFGRGIVDTTNDLGSKGGRPSHPELLDWLAREFPQRDWSVKELVRLLVTSATYRQASVHPAGEVAANSDPDNNLLWRMRVRRLDSEQIRDALLVASGKIDTKMGGAGVNGKTDRRSVYQVIMRNQRPAFRKPSMARTGSTAAPGATSRPRRPRHS